MREQNLNGLGERSSIWHDQVEQHVGDQGPVQTQEGDRDGDEDPGERRIVARQQNGEEGEWHGEEHTVAADQRIGSRVTFAVPRGRTSTDDDTKNTGEKGDSTENEVNATGRREKERLALGEWKV